MEIDIKIFNKINVIDSCSIWNIMSSNLLLTTSLQNKCYFSITKYVEYECLVKARKSTTEQENALKRKMEKLLSDKAIQSYTLDISDLQQIELLRNRKRLGLGELSSIAFAKRTNQCFFTDDQKARKLAKEILGTDKVQTTPHLYGWLLFNYFLNETDLSQIIDEHNYFKRPLEPYFKEVYNECMRIRLMSA